MIEKQKTCCFTGHRLLLGADKDLIYTLLLQHIDALTAEGITNFCCGGALGFDTLSAAAVLEAKKSNPALRLHLFLPYSGQEARWRVQEKDVYRRIIKQADDVVCLSDTYTPDCFHARNRAMVDCSSVCIAHVKRSGGASYTVSYARAQGLRLIFLC